jgi:hypothetical protein
MFEVFVWSLVYWLLGVAPNGAVLVDFAFVNYTTLGYGDVTPVKEWRLLGPMTAMNGVLMFGWSTAVLFEVLLKAIERYWSLPSSSRSSQIEFSQLRPVQQHDLPLGLAEKAK